ncbi:hypothetical protein ACHWQZ_G016727 [Mnemiopsis leidyi]
MGCGASVEKDYISIDSSTSSNASPQKPRKISEPPSKDICPYTLLIQTGSYYPQQSTVSRWHEGSVFVTINPYSEQTESKVLEVKGSFGSDSEGTVSADFWLPPTVGAPLLVKIAIKSKFSKITKDPLYIRKITILYDEAKYHFPAKNYLFPHNELQDKPTNGCLPFLLVRGGAGMLLHQETENFVVKARNSDLEMTRSMHPWNRPNVEERPKLFPGFAGKQECRTDGTETFNKKFSHKAGLMALTNILDDLLGVLPDTFSKLEEYATFIRHNGDEQGWSKCAVHRALKVAKVCGDDEEMGREMLCGPNSGVIRRVEWVEGGRWEGGVEKLPDYVLEGKSLEDAMIEGRIFEITNDNLIGVPHGGKSSKLLTGGKQIWYVVPADCMFYVNDNKKLVPIMIRLENKTDGSKPTFWYPPKPESEKGEHGNLRWLLAKLYFRSAEVNTHSICTLYARAHAVNEVFAVAAYRNLASAHPVFRLLQPHLQGIIPVQLQARKFLLGKNSVFAKFLSAGDNLGAVFDNYFKTFNYRDLIFPEEMKKRGVEDLPGYHYREDSLAHWNLLEKYVTDMVELSYPTEDDIKEDIEIQNFVREVVDEGYRYRGFPESAGFPRSISSKDNLVEYLTAIIFNISSYRAAVNSDTFTFYSFTPNAPPSLKLPPPKQDEIVTLERIMNSLPVPVISFIAMDIFYRLSTPSPQTRFYLGEDSLGRIGMEGEHMTLAPHQREVVERLVSGMRELKRGIERRNEGVYFKYDVLSPENVPITIQD